MAITVTQLLPFEWVLGESVQTEYRVVGSEVEDDVEAQVEADIPATYQDLANRTITLRLLLADGENSQWHARAKWSRSVASWSTSPDRDTGDNVYQFEVGAESQHVTQSLETINSYGLAPPAFDGAIGVSAEGGNQRVQGIDVGVGFFRWSETHYLTNATVTAAYRKAVADLVNTPINDDTFRVAPGSGTTFAAGTVRFLGARGTQRADDWEITFSFAYSPEVTFAIDLQGVPTNITKGGWEYVWYYYQQDASGADLITRPKFAYVERVYESGDFDDLGI